MSEQEKTRRETLKLAAAVAAFGTALGYRQTVEGAGSTQLKLENKRELKFELKHMELKLYDGDRPVHGCQIPAGALRQIKLDSGRLEHKVYVNGAQWDLKANRKV
jgi:hypothetical protein